MPRRASGLVNTTVQLGTATGIALFGTVFFTRLGNDDAYVPATAGTLLVSCGVLVIGLLLTAVLPRRQRDEHSGLSTLSLEKQGV